MKVYVYLKVFILILLVAGCAVQKDIRTEPTAFTNVVPAFSAHNAMSESVIYALPKTMLRFTIVANKVYRRQGPLYRYSDLYMNIDQVITQNTTEWNLKSVSVEPVGIMDQSQIYKVNFKGNTGSGNVELAENGCIKSVNVPQFENAELERLLPPKISAGVDTSFASIPLTEELLRSNSTSKMAEEAAAFIYRLRENRFAMVSGELDLLPNNGKSLALSIRQMDNLEKEYMSLFIGKEGHEEISMTFDYVPKSAVTKEILLRFSKFKGVVSMDDFSGSPLHITLTPNALMNLPENEVEPTYDKKGALIELVKKNGLYYRLPAMSTLKVDYDNKQVLSKQLQVAQFGKVLSLPSELLDNNKRGVVFYPETGAIKKILTQ